jgi:hypothetical protein
MWLAVWSAADSSYPLFAKVSPHRRSDGQGTTGTTSTCGHVVNSEPLVKTLVDRQAAIRLTHVPLAIECRGVTRIGEQLAQVRRACGRALGLNIVVLEADTLPRQRVNWRRRGRSTVATDIPSADVINRDC